VPKVKAVSVLKCRLITALPSHPHPGLDPFSIEKEIHKDGKCYSDAQYGEAVAQLLKEKQVEENHGLFRKTSPSF
jgi:hypothetical protein